jgi:hypothetical protein
MNSATAREAEGRFETLVVGDEVDQHGHVERRVGVIPAGHRHQRFCDFDMQ